MFRKMNKDIFNFDGNSRKHQREPLTPYKIVVVSLIKLYCNDKHKVNVERKDFCIASLKLIQSADMKLEDLFKLLFSNEYVLIRITFLLKEELNALYQVAVERILDLFESLRKLIKSTEPLSTPALHKNSVLGLYIRRMIVLFESLTFDDIIALYEDFKAYVKEWEHANSPNTSKYFNDTTPYKSRNAWAGRHAELAVAQQAHALQTDEHKALLPKKLQSLIDDLLRCSPYSAEAHYLSYLNCLRVNEYCGAIDSLYHCFDTLAPLENRPTDGDKSQMFRYAALNLAALHVQFNHKEVAKSALKEAIMMAQDAGDNVCLQLAHAWMYNLTDDKKKGPLIERSIGKATSLGITPTQSLGFIASAHNAAMESKNPQVIFETLTNADLLNCQNSMLDLISVTYVERAALWAYYGKTEMSSVCSQLLLLYNSGEKKQYMFNGPSTCQAVVNIANILVEFGAYQQANTCFAHAKERFPNEPNNKIWMLSERLYEFTKLIRHGKWSEAEVIAKEISSLNALESLFRFVDVYLAKGDYPRAFKCLQKIENSPNITAQNKVRAMILSSQVACSSIYVGNGVTGCNSLVLLNSALELAAKNHLSYYGALIKMHIANIQLLLNMPYHALKLVEEAIIQILAHGGLYDQGQAFVLYAKCMMATCSEVQDNTKQKVMLDVIKALTKAKAAFDKVEAFGRVKSTLHLLCLTYNELEMKNERNQCAFEFLKLDQQFPARPDDISLY